jgi:hypothetical protein
MPYRSAVYWKRISYHKHLTRLGRQYRDENGGKVDPEGPIRCERRKRRL